MIVIDNMNGTKIISYMPKDLRFIDGEIVMRTGNHYFAHKIKKPHRPVGERYVDRFNQIQKYYEDLRKMDPNRSVRIQLPSKATVRYAPISSSYKICEPMINKRMKGEDLELRYMTLVGNMNTNVDKTAVNTIFLKGNRVICDLVKDPSALILTFHDEDELEDWFHETFSKQDLICDLSVGEIRIFN